MTDRKFPIMDAPDIPWLVIAPHEGQALANHGQTLEKLARRGGLSASEALAVITDHASCFVSAERAKQLLRPQVVHLLGVMVGREDIGLIQGGTTVSICFHNSNPERAAELFERLEAALVAGALHVEVIPQLPAKEEESPPCKNRSRVCRGDGGCLRCDADAGEACR